MVNQPGSGGAVNDAPPLDFIEFLAGELRLARDAAERLLGSELRLFYTAPPEPFASRTLE
jgi:hypothetical protein